MTFATTNDSAMGTLDYARADHDFYPTQPWVTEAVIEPLKSLLRDCPELAGEPVWEPACGDGAMASVLAGHFPQVIATDIADHGYGTHGVDFLATTSPLARIIVTNPPYGDDAERFLRHALKLTASGGVVAMLLRNEYDCSRKRAGLFQAPPFAQKLVLTSRPRWIAGSTGSPRHNYAWYIFVQGSTAPACIAYHVRP